MHNRGIAADRWLGAYVATYAERDACGREVDLIVDRGHDLIATVIKSGATVHPSFFDTLNRFTALAREAVPPAPDGVRPLLVYGGDRRQRRSSGEVLPWRAIQTYPWTAEADRS